MTIDELIREFEELAELAADALRDEGRTDAIRRSYAHAARLAREAKASSGGMKSADEYAELTERAIAAGARSAQHDDPHAYIWVGEMTALSSLALAAATLEAARLMGPTPQETAVLNALTAPQLCGATWTDAQATIPAANPDRHIGQEHRCGYTAGHEQTEPHYCKCGAEL